MFVSSKIYKQKMTIM